MFNRVEFIIIRTKVVHKNIGQACTVKSEDLKVENRATSTKHKNVIM